MHHDELYKFAATKLLPSGIIRPDDMESLPSQSDVSSESEDNFYEFTTDQNQKKPLRKGKGGGEEEAFRRGREAAIQMHGGRKMTQVVGKDVVTGIPVIYDQVSDARLMCRARPFSLS